MSKLNSTAKLVLIHMQEIATEIGSKDLTTTNAELAAKIERGNREVTRAISALEKAGLIKVDINPRRQPIRIVSLL